MADTRDLEKKVMTLSSRPADKFLDLAYALRLLKDRSREAFRRVVKKGGLGTRKAYYLLNLADQFHSTPGIRARLHQIGWTKAQVIGRHLPGTNILKLLEYAEGHTTKELEAYAGKKQASDTTRCVLLYFTPEQYRRYEKAALKCGATKRGRGLTDKEAATIKMANNEMRR
jgi:hypothetical protein